MQDRKKKKSVWKWPYRLVLLNDISLGEVFSVRFTPLNFLLLLAGITLFMSTVLTGVIAFTPLKELIPGYGTEEERLKLQQLVRRTDSLENIALQNDSLLRMFKRVVSGNIIPDKGSKPQKDLTSGTNENIPPSPFQESEKYLKQLEDLKSADVRPGALPKSIISPWLFPSSDPNTLQSIDSLGRLCLWNKDEIHIISPIEGRVVTSSLPSASGILFIQSDEGYQVIIENLNSLMVATGMFVKKGEYLGSTSQKVYIRFFERGKKILPQQIF